jgi:hypothetical protein
MRVRADQLIFGDELNGCEVVWVLRTPDRRSVGVGLKPACHAEVGSPG